MHPGFMHWWRQQQQNQGGAAACGAGAWAHGPGRHRHHHHHGGDEAEGFFAAEDGGGFGVRRPLRFMAHRLELREEQVAELAAILDALKTERAQAAVDYRRSVGNFADAIAAETFDVSTATAAAEARVKTAQSLRDAVVKALQKTHAMLDADQRKELAYLLRSGQLTI